MGFAMPDAPEMIVTDNGPTTTQEAPLEQPVFEEPDKPTPELHQIEPAAKDSRDPSAPFNGSSAPNETEYDPTQPLVAINSSELMTQGSAWGSASNRHTPLAGTIVGGRYLPPPTGQPVVSSEHSGMSLSQPSAQSSPNPNAGYPPAASASGYPTPPSTYPANPGQAGYPAAGVYPPNTAIGGALSPTPPRYPPATGGYVAKNQYSSSAGYPANPYPTSGTPSTDLSAPVPLSGPLNLGQSIRAVGIRVYIGVFLGILFPEWAVWALLFSWLSTTSIPRFGAKLNQLIAGVVFIRFLLTFVRMFYSSLPYSFTTTLSSVMCWALLFAMPLYVYHLAKTGKA